MHHVVLKTQKPVVYRSIKYVGGSSSAAQVLEFCIRNQLDIEYNHDTKILKVGGCGIKAQTTINENDWLVVDTKSKTHSAKVVSSDNYDKDYAVVGLNANGDIVLKY